MATNYNPRIVTDGLVLCLDAANPKSYPGSGTTWYDLSGNSNDADIDVNTTISADNFAFIGSNSSHVDTTVDLSGTQAITLDFLCKLDDYTEVDGGGKLICELSNNFNSSSEGFYIGIIEDSNVAFLNNYDISLNIKGNAGYNLTPYNKESVNDLQWHHWSCILDKSITGSGTSHHESKLFIDGQEQTPNTYLTSGFKANNTNNFGNLPFYIGGRTGSSFGASFKISNFKIYNKALTAAEVKQNFEATRGRFGV
jgi:hypothetical protein